jgi:hypothetical protein
VAGLTGEQLPIERPELRIGAVGCQQGHALVAAGLDQSRHEKGIEHPLWFGPARLGAQGGAVARRRQRPQGDGATLQELQHLLEMLQLFPGQWTEHLPELAIAGIAKHQLQGDASSFALAVGVIDQDQMGMGDRLLHPGGAAGGHQPFHPDRGIQERARRWATSPSRARV